MPVDVKVGDYQVIQNEDGSLVARRHGLPWRCLTGDNLILCLAMRIEELENACYFASQEYRRGGSVETAIGLVEKVIGESGTPDETIDLPTSK